MFVLESPFAAALNRLLASEPWARERLAPFAQETVEFRAPALPALRLTIAADGRLAPAASGVEPSLTVTLGPESLPALARGEEHFMRSVHVSGNAKLASEVLLLVRHLRWDAEEDLAHVVGDVAAHRVVRFAKEILSWQVDAAKRLAGSAAEYLIEERGLLVARAEYEALATAAAKLRDDLDRLEARLRRLD
jgi:ubiquinone biosynthesis protein UbiJ